MTIEEFDKCHGTKTPRKQNIYRVAGYRAIVLASNKIDALEHCNLVSSTKDILTTTISVDVSNFPSDRGLFHSELVDYLKKYDEQLGDYTDLFI